MTGDELLNRFHAALNALQAALRAGDYPAFVERLTELARLRHALAHAPTVSESWQRVRGEAAAMLRMDAGWLSQMVPKLPADSPQAALLTEASGTAVRAAGELEALGAAPDAASRAQEILGRAETALREAARAALRHDEHLLDEARRRRREELLDHLAAGSQEVAACEAAWWASLDDDSVQVELVRAVTIIAIYLTGAAARAGQHRWRLQRLDLPAAADWHRRSNVEALAKLNRFLEGWRGGLADDWARIEAMDGARTAHAAFVTALYDLGALPEAFAAAEMARARALADLMTPGRRTARVLTPDRLRRALRGRAVVEYFLAGDRLLIFCLSPEGELAAADRTVDRAALTAAVDRLHALLTAHDLDSAGLAELGRLLEELGRTLWEPLPWLPEDDRPLLVVPHEELLRVPFAALRTPDGRPVAARHPTSVLPAAALAARLPEHPARPGGPALHALVAPEPMPEPDLRPLDRLARRFPAIAARYPGPVRVRYGDRATVAELAHVPRLRPDVLCLATHAKALPERPLESYIALAGERLEARRVAELELPARLVILAACESGAGRVSADGVIGLSRSFLLAGAGAVLMTLWSLTERDTLALLTRFHDHYLAGAAPARALRAAQAELAAVYHDDPRRWAAYVLFGSPD